MGKLKPTFDMEDTTSPMIPINPIYAAQLRLLKAGWVEGEPLVWKQADGRMLFLEDSIWFYHTASGTAHLGPDFVKAVEKITENPS